MGTGHPKVELTSYLRGELSPPERDRVRRHLQGCPDCQRTAGTFQTLLEDLRQSMPAPPEVHWERYRAELLAKIRDRADRSLKAPHQWWFRPVPLTCAASLAAMLLLIAVQGGLHRERPREDLVAFEETLIGHHLDLLQHLALVERLDLLEDFDVIRHLDQPFLDGDG